MAHSARNSLKKSRIVEDRNQRLQEPVQPGARARLDRGLSPEEAIDLAKHRFGKTNKHSSEDGSH